MGRPGQMKKAREDPKEANCTNHGSRWLSELFSAKKFLKTDPALFYLVLYAPQFQPLFTSGFHQSDTHL